MTERYVDADPRMLRAIAHPARASLLYELSARGAATATTLAEAIGKPVNSVSFHLRQLASYGLIEEAPDQGSDARQRWWRTTVPEGLRVSSSRLRETAEGEAAYEVFRRHNVAHWHALVDRFFAGHDGSTEVWTGNDVSLSLTKSEAEQLSDELYDVMTRWVERGRAKPGPADDKPASSEERRTYLLVSLLMPHQTDLVD